MHIESGGFCVLMMLDPCWTCGGKRFAAQQLYKGDCYCTLVGRFYASSESMNLGNSVQSALQQGFDWQAIKASC